ncbi:MAG: uridine kinase [Acidobacteriota bacterium]
MSTRTRPEIVELLAERILGVRVAHPARIGIDGVDAAGKTTLAGELADSLAGSGRDVIRASVDGFHRPRVLRYARGRDSATGYYEDSFDYPVLRDVLLDPLGPGGDRRYRRAVFDHTTDAPVLGPIELAAVDAILLFDGIFLQRPELRGCFERVVFLEVSPDTAVARSAGRSGGSSDAGALENRRYVEGQEIYRRAVRPSEKADIVVDNEDIEAPRLVRG